MAIVLTVTDAGRAALINAAHNGTAPVTIAHVGISATPVVPAPAMTALPGETKRIATISGDVVAADTIHLIVRDESTSAFTVRSFALYLADGTLFALYGQSDVILEKSSQAMMLLAIDVQFADIDATQLTFGDANFLNPPATTEVEGVIEIATEDETTTGVDTRRAVVPKALKTAVTSWINSRFGEGAPSTFVKGLLTAASDVAMRTALGLKSAALKNEGAGNGLDSDLLDGQHGAYYADIAARLGYVPWGPNNDGAGSGLDAGLLAGQLPSYYTDILSRLGYTPVNKAGDTMTGLLALSANPTASLHAAPKQYVDGLTTAAATLARLLTVDGSGSGLDADFLDGFDSSYFTAIAARLGYTPLNKAGDTVNGALGVDGDLTLSNSGTVGYINRPNVAGSKRITFNVKGGGNLEAFDIYSESIRFNGGIAWSSINDGSGSGLDADYLDGKDSSAFFPVTGGGITGFTYLAYSSEYVGFGIRNNYGNASRAANTFLDSINENGITVGNIQFGQNADGSSNVLIGLTPAGSRTTDRRKTAMLMRGDGNPLDFYASSMWNNGVRIWDGSSDGSGSGLDADMLDGLHASEFVRLSDGSMFGSNANGYWEKRPNGVIEQWGVVTEAHSEGASYHNFPINFTDLASVCVQLTIISQGNTGNDMFIQLHPTATSLSQFAAYYQSQTSGNTGYGFAWRAVGR